MADSCPRPPLSKRDMDVLGMIRDPEAGLASTLQPDPALPRDPHIVDAAEYDCVSQAERALIQAVQRAEAAAQARESAGPASEPSKPADAELIEAYRVFLADMGRLVAAHPAYASARNNRAQALRRLYGDDMLVEAETASPERASTSSSSSSSSSRALLRGAAAPSERERAEAAAAVLADLDQAVALLMPSSSRGPAPAALSPTAARTLSLALTQRGALYLATARQLASPRRSCCCILARLDDPRRPEARWRALDFEEAASRNFALGARFGSEMARVLAVGTNPTAKLCGQMVQQMMKSVYPSPV